MSASINLSDSRALRSVPPDLRPVVRAAGQLGWTARARSAGGMLLFSPNGSDKVSIPGQVGDAHTVANAAKAIIRFTPTADRNHFVDLVENGRGKPGVEKSVVDMRAVIELAEPGVLAKAQRTADEELAVEAAGTEVVSEAPWMARVSTKGDTADLYESNSVLVQTLANGTTTYLCPVCRAFSSDKPWPVANHAGWHTRKDEKARAVVEPTKFDVPVTDVRHNRLAREILSALRSVEKVDDLEEYARLLAVNILTARPAHVIDDTASTPEEVLARIKRLVLRDEQDKLVQAQAEADAQREQIAALTTDLDASRREARRARETLSALAEMAKEEGGS